MSTPTAASDMLRAALTSNQSAVLAVLRRYHARNPRLFGSVARGEATGGSDLDLLIDLDPDGGNELLRVAGIGEELSRLLGRRVDVVTPSLLRDEVAKTALVDAVAL